MEPLGKVLKKSRTLPKLVKAQAPLTRSREKLLDAAVHILGNPEASEPAFLARELVQCTLPHSDPGKVESWTRRNGNLTLTLWPGRDVSKGTLGYPYGILPRLLLFWMTTEAIRTRSRKLQLGHTLSAFMREVGLDPNTGGGKRSDARRLQEQMRRLFKATVGFQLHLEEGSRRGEAWLDMQVAPVGELWWDAKFPDQGALWGSWIELGEKFYEAITAAPVPVDMRVLKAIKRSPLALDLYAWATWRVFKLSKPAFIPWDGLLQQMGAEYTNTKDFAQKVKTAFRKIRAVYPALNVSYGKGGMMLHPSRTAIAPATKRA